MNPRNEEGLVPVYLLQAYGKNFPKTVAGFPEDLAIRLVAAKIATWDLEGGPAAAPEEPASEPKVPATPASVEIPANWQELHYLQQVKLAKEIAGSSKSMTAKEAVEVITAEVARRANPEGVN